ncbi:MAG: hypothetical protein PHZ04_01325 [Patescibacteria group bacterium]|nr:hypothetical protein [Patescibacteria group bacterium]MDD5294470.1 hypothetical protein [Patescibacteria group bacterium]MDD5554381.1 hypothetical protein [Patescibacteria group bacterium]
MADNNENTAQETSKNLDESNRGQIFLDWLYNSSIAEIAYCLDDFD